MINGKIWIQKNCQPAVPGWKRLLLYYLGNLVPKGSLLQPGGQHSKSRITNDIWPMTLKAKMASSHRSSHTSEDESGKHRRRMEEWGETLGSCCGGKQQDQGTNWMGKKKKKGTSEDTRLHTGQTDREKNDSERIKKKILKGEMSFLLLLFFSAMSSMTELNNLRHF